MAATHLKRLPRKSIRPSNTDCVVSQIQFAPSWMKLARLSGDWTIQKPTNTTTRPITTTFTALLDQNASSGWRRRAGQEPRRSTDRLALCCSAGIISSARQGTIAAEQLDHVVTTSARWSDLVVTTWISEGAAGP